MEENVVEAITNNILGTCNLVEAATACAVQTFVLISTDKAVRPTSVMGCTKRVAEQIVRAAAQATGRNFLSVDAVPAVPTEFGQLFELSVMLQGPTGDPRPVVTVWIVRRAEDFPRLVTAYPGVLR